jgi:two-component system, LuxR family, sensor kinase FixL
VSPDTLGKSARMLGVAIDTTGRRQSELELGQQRNELAHLSRVTMLGELAGSLAHELNQPLTAILSNAQAAQRFLAHDSTDLSEVRDILADIVAEDKRAGEVIRRLRLLLKKGEVQLQPIRVNEVVLEVLKLVRSDLVNQGVTARTELAPDLPALHGDRVQLQQVLLNLVMNACDAMASAVRDDRQILICTDQVGGESVRISVSDRGAGIAPENLERVFEAFYSTKPHGMGLGLAVCRTIITAHGGNLWAANNPGRGATFHLTLPMSAGGTGAKGE